jgi:hypothetical protein
MGLQCVGLIGVGAVVAIANVFTTRSLWSSPMFERSQKIAQTVLMWLVPGTFVVTRHLVRGSSSAADSSDPTVNRQYGIADDPTVYHHGHGDDGGHH